jgi:capsular exopolysaccharide synthesis family protein
MLLGSVLAVGEAYLLEYLDDTLKWSEDVRRLFSAPIIGYIFEQKNKKGENLLYDSSNLRHPAAEAFRVLRTNIEFAQRDQSLKTILVTSADIGDGKTSVAANLALSLSHKEKKVVLLDGDLRRPKVHEYYDLPNDKGLVDLLDGDLRWPKVPEFFSLFSDKGVIDPYLNRSAIEDTFQFKRDKNVAVLTAGSPPQNPTELLSSDKMDHILSELKAVADIVIIDGPPFIVADAMVMASKVDGILMVVRPGHTRLSMARVAAEKIKMAEARLIGVVLNRIPQRGADYFAGKSYLATYKLSNYGMESIKNGKYHRKEMKEKPSSIEK